LQKHINEPSEAKPQVKDVLEQKACPAGDTTDRRSFSPGEGADFIDF